MKTSVKTENYSIKELKKTYQADQQLKYIHLEAEINLLLHQIQNNKNKQNENN